MLTGTEVANEGDVANEVIASRRAEAREAALSTAVRLARRQQRLTNRMRRVDERLAGG
ncbi:MAG: hypothetical protein WKF54_11685 [Nocardioidaceae bacterium]